jgi:hypothetical protein
MITQPHLKGTESAASVNLVDIPIDSWVCHHPHQGLFRPHTGKANGSGNIYVFWKTFDRFQGLPS